jgi:hypothetical protein
LGLSIFTDFTHYNNGSETLFEGLNDASVFAEFSIKLAWGWVFGVDDKGCIGVDFRQ